MDQLTYGTFYDQSVGKKYLVSILQELPKFAAVKLNRVNIRNKFQKYRLVKPELFRYANVVATRYFSKESDRKSSESYNKHNYDKEIEKLMNEQINVEFKAGYNYLNIASYFGQSNVAFPGFYGFFMSMYYEEQEHALQFIKYQHLRGGIVKYCPITTTQPNTEWPNIVDAFFCALRMEKDVKEKILIIYRQAEKVNDTNVMDMLDPFIQQQEQSIHDIARLATRAKFLKDSKIGVYLFDRELHETYVKSGNAKCVADVGNKLYT